MRAPGVPRTLRWSGSPLQGNLQRLAVLLDQHGDPGAVVGSQQEPGKRRHAHAPHPAELNAGDHDADDRISWAQPRIIGWAAWRDRLDDQKIILTGQAEACVGAGMVRSSPLA